VIVKSTPSLPPLAVPSHPTHINYFLKKVCVLFSIWVIFSFLVVANMISYPYIKHCALIYLFILQYSERIKEHSDKQTEKKVRNSLLRKSDAKMQSSTDIHQITMKAWTLSY